METDKMLNEAPTLINVPWICNILGVELQNIVNKNMYLSTCNIAIKLMKLEDSGPLC